MKTFAAFILAMLAHVHASTNASAACPNIKSYEDALKENRARRDYVCGEMPGSTECAAARDYVTLLEKAVRDCRAQREESSGGPSVNTSGSTEAIVRSLADLLARRAARDAEREAAREAEREAERLEAERREREEFRELQDTLEKAFDRGAKRRSKRKASGCDDPVIRAIFDDACRGVGAGGDAHEEPASPTPEPAREEVGGCPSSDDLFVQYGAESRYPAPESYSSGLLLSGPSCKGVWTWCVPADSWRAHKAQHGTPPPIYQCWAWE